MLLSLSRGGVAMHSKSKRAAAAHMPDMVSVSVSRAKSMLEGGRVARGHEVFGQQGRPRLWHDRLETQFFRQLVRGTRFFPISRAKSMLEGGRVARGHEVFGQQGRPRLWHDRLETQFFRQLVRELGSSLPIMETSFLSPTWLYNFPFPSLALLAVLSSLSGRRGFSDP